MATVLITGGNRGIGLELARQYSARGDAVIVACRESTPELDSLGVEVVQGIDVSSSESVVGLVFALNGRKLDCLVNNAAYCSTCQVADMKEAEWNYTLQVNLTGAFLCAREFVKRLIAREQPGRLVNISSQAAFRGSTTGHAPYDSSKGALMAFTVSLAREVAANNIVVNCVAPGMMHTEMTDKVLTADKQKYIDRIPIRRIGRPEDVARVVVFLAGEGAAYMTGATVDVSGGLAMR